MIGPQTLISSGLKRIYDKDVKQVAKDVEVPQGSFIDFALEVPEGYTGMLATLEARFEATATTTGIRIIFLYSFDGTDYDDEENAEYAGNYEDMLIPAGASNVVRQRSFIIPCTAPYLKLRVKNLDPTNPARVDLWRACSR